MQCKWGCRDNCCPKYEDSNHPSFGSQMLGSFGKAAKTVWPSRLQTNGHKQRPWGWYIPVGLPCICKVKTIPMLGTGLWKYGTGSNSASRWRSRSSGCSLDHFANNAYSYSYAIADSCSSTFSACITCPPRSEVDSWFQCAATSLSCQLVGSVGCFPPLPSAV